MPCSQIGAEHAPRSARGGDLDEGLRRARDARPLSAVQHLDADEHVGDGELEPDELDAPARQPLGPRVDRVALDPRVGQLLHARHGVVLHPVRQLQHHREPHARQHGRSPQNLEVPRLRLLQLEIGGARLVGARDRRRRERREQRRQEARDPPSPAHRVASSGGAGRSTVYFARISS